MNMIERVARAMYDATPFKETEGGYDAQSETYRRMCELLSRAAIEAMREPTDAMIDVGEDELNGFHVRSGISRDIYRTMVNVALLEQTP